MAQTTILSSKELKRQAGLVFEGKTLKVMLCALVLEGYTEESTVANWQSIELSGNGYARYSEVIPTGAYDTQIGAYIIPDIAASFIATSAYSFNRVVLYIDGETYIHSIIQETTGSNILAGQTQTYLIKLRQDD
jgi:hypothetical protein